MYRAVNHRLSGDQPTEIGRPELRSFLALIVVCASFVLVSAVPVFAYDETGSGRTCVECHGLESGESAVPEPTVTRKGPHGGYTTGTQKCQTCHTVHVAPLGSTMLLPAATIKDTCNTCHDGTGGGGVYGVLTARGVTPNSAHRVEVTNLVPGGAEDGSDTTATFSASGGFLTCSDCHSPHDAQTVDPFTGDRVRAATETPQSEATVLAPATNRLLKQLPTSADTSTTVYGSSWCGGCHKGRLYGSAGVVNHPVETETAGFNYDNVVRVTGPNVSTVEMGTLGGSNYGYVMPVPRDPLQDGRDPICQQCHEDPRGIGDDPLNPQQISTQNGFNERFNVTTADGTTATDNPRFQTFPHESETRSFLVEENDDLCLNCHVPPGG